MKAIPLFIVTSFLLLTASINVYSFEKLITKTNKGEIISDIIETKITIIGGKIKKLVIIGKTEDRKYIKNICIINEINDKHSINWIMDKDNKDKCIYCTDLKSNSTAQYIDFKFNTNGTYVEVKKCK